MRLLSKIRLDLKNEMGDKDKWNGLRYSSDGTKYPFLSLLLFGMKVVGGGGGSFAYSLLTTTVVTSSSFDS